VPHRSVIAALAALAAATLAPAAPAAAQVFGGVDRKEPLARFADPLCPGVVGLKRDFAESVVGRIRQTIEELDMPLADPATCEANVLVMVMPDGRGYVNRLRTRKPFLFDQLPNAKRTELFEGEGPVRSWTRVATRSRDGMVVEQRLSLDMPPQMSAAMAHSKIYVATRRDILSAATVVDAAALPAVSVTQLADYATMRARAGDGSEALAMPGGTILTLFADPAPAPEGLTASPRMFLATLYTEMPNLPAALTLATAQRRIDALAE